MRLIYFVRLFYARHFVIVAFLIAADVQVNLVKQTCTWRSWLPIGSWMHTEWFFPILSTTFVAYLYSV